MRRRKSEGSTTTTLFVTTGGQSNNLLSIDATNPRQPAAVGAGSAAMSQQRIALLTDVTFTGGGDNRVFTGDLAVTTHFSVNFSSMGVLRRHQPGGPGHRRREAPDAQPRPPRGRGEHDRDGGDERVREGCRRVQDDDRRRGLRRRRARRPDADDAACADVALNTPQRTAGDRVSEGAFSGQITDVAAGRSSLFAISPTSGPELLRAGPGGEPRGPARASRTRRGACASWTASRSMPTATA